MLKMERNIAIFGLSNMLFSHRHKGSFPGPPYRAFKKAGFEVYFATENGKTPECDKKMLRGVTQKLLVSTSSHPS
jgi:hypothetical protein